MKRKAALGGCALGRERNWTSPMFLTFRIESRDGYSWLSTSGMNYNLEMEGTPVGDFFFAWFVMGESTSSLDL